MIPLLILLIFICEAWAHSVIIKGLTVCGQDQEDNDKWHTAFSFMWFFIGCLAWYLHSWEVGVHLIASRAFVFPIALNVFRGFPIFHLGSSHYDGVVSKMGNAVYYAIVFIIYLSSIYIIYA